MSVNTLKEGGYLTLIGEALRPKTGQRGTVLDLFAGCGGLALGFESVGFETIGFEADSDCCSTYRKNLKGECYEVFLNSQFKFPNADIVIGGPPCQPFSVGGNLACRIFCTSVIETTALALSDPDGAVRA